MSRHEIWQDIVATHFLESQIKVSQTGLNYGRYSSHSQSEEPSTGMNRYENMARHNSHSQTEESRTGIMSSYKIWQGTVATHKLRSQGHQQA